MPFRPVEFEVVREMPWKEVEERLRAVTLLNSDIRPYENADIKLRRFNYKQVRPTSLYTIAAQTKKQRLIRADLVVQLQPSQLEMKGGLVIAGGDKGPQGLIPPIVETFEPEENTYLLDGSHRTNLGRTEHVGSFMAIHISGIRPDCPPYAFPNEWSEVQELAEPPSDPSVMKNYRNFDDRYALYRDFAPINGSTPRLPSA